jgi:hypothetical protein
MDDEVGQIEAENDDNSKGEGEFSRWDKEGGID